MNSHWSKKLITLLTPCVAVVVTVVVTIPQSPVVGRCQRWRARARAPGRRRHRRGPGAHMPRGCRTDR